MGLHQWTFKWVEKKLSSQLMENGKNLIDCHPLHSCWQHLNDNCGKMTVIVQIRYHIQSVHQYVTR